MVGSCKTQLMVGSCKTQLCFQVLFFPLSFKPKNMFAKADMNLYPYREILEAESVDQIKAINPIPRTPGIHTMTILRSCQFIPSGMADLILRSNAKSVEDSIMVAKAYVMGSLETIPLDLDLEEPAEGNEDGEPEAPAVAG